MANKKYDYSHNHGYIEISKEIDMKQQIIKASEFKAKCLQLMDEVKRTGKEIIITKNGTPVSKLVGIRSNRAQSLYGAHRNSIAITGDIVGPLEVEWEAQK